MRSWDPRRVRTIYKKEIVETLRDRRTLATMLLVPMVGYPLALLATSETLAVHQQQIEEREVRVLIDGDLPVSTIEALDAAKSLEVRLARPQPPRSQSPAGTSSTASTSAARARSLLDPETVDVLIIARPGARRALEGTGTAELELYYDSTQNHAPHAADRVEDALTDHGVAMRDQRMRRLGLPPTAARPLSIIRRSVATAADLGNQLASTTLPALVLLFIAISCFYPAVDITAGEKERKTLATLLTAPVRAIDIVVGKYLAVVTVGTLAGLLNVTVLGLTLLRVLSQRPETNEAALRIPPATIAALFLSVFLIALPVAALMLLVATLARSFRDASNLLTPVLLVATAPAVMSSLPGFELTPILASVPLINAALLMKALVLGRAELGTSALVIASTFAATAALLLAASRVFTDERVLFSTEGRRADLRSLLLSPPPIAVSTALALSAVVFVLNYYGGLAAFGAPPMVMVAVTQLLAHVMPAVLFALWMRRVVPARELLMLGPPALPASLAAVLIGAGAWLGISLPCAWLQAALMPGQEEAAKAMKEALGLDGVSLPIAVVVLALLPAIAEELIFRGAIFGLLRRVSAPVTAIVAQAVIFGAMHGSVFRILPTAALGALLGWVALRSGSLWPGVIIHAMTNAILLSIDRLATEEQGRMIAEPTPLALVGLGLVAVGLYVSRRAR